MNQIKHIRLDKLSPPVFDARITTSPVDDAELQESIRELGIIEPLIIKSTENGYEIIAGNRRFNAAGVVGLSAVPCVIMKVTGAESEAIKIHENMKRLQPSHVDQAVTFEYMIKTYDMTEKQIAVLTGKSMAYISQHLSLLHSDPLLVKAVQNGRINFGVARELMLVKDNNELLRLSKIAAENGITSKVAHTWRHEANRETDILAGVEVKPVPVESSAPFVEPTFPCQCCDKTFRVAQMYIFKLCPTCVSVIKGAASSPGDASQS